MHEKNTTIQWRAVTSETSHAIGTPKPGHQIGYIHDQFKVISKNKKQNKKKSLQTSLRFLTFPPKFTIFSKITQKNESSFWIGLRFHPKQVIFLIEFHEIYLIAQKFVRQFLKIWSCNA